MTLLFCLLTLSTARAQEALPNLAQLVREWRALPAPASEGALTALRNNPWFDDILVNPAARVAPTLALIERKEVLLARLFQQALLELPDAESVGALLLDGVVPGEKLPTLPTVRALRSLRALFEIVSLMNQCESGVRGLLPELLALRGDRYPCTDSLGRGLVRFVALAATDGPLFGRALDVLERLPADVNAEFNWEISYVPGERNAATRAQMVRHIVAQADVRAGAVRRDLLAALAKLDDPAARQYVARLVDESRDEGEWITVVRHLAARADGGAELYEDIARALERWLQRHPVGLEPLLRSVFGTLTSTISASTDIVDRGPRALLEALFKHADPRVRRVATGFVREFKEDHATYVNRLRPYLYDDDAATRICALAVLWGYPNFDKMPLVPELRRVSTRDSSPDVRRMARQTARHILREHRRACERRLL